MYISVTCAGFDPAGIKPAARQRCTCLAAENHVFTAGGCFIGFSVFVS